MIPKILLAATCRWFAVARLAMAFKNAGFSVDLICPPGHPALRTSAVDHAWRYVALQPVRSIRAAMERSRPDLLVPCDDLATAHLHAIHRAATREGKASTVWLRQIIEHSLGDAANYPVATARSSLIALAEAEGIRVPPTAVIEDAREIAPWIQRHGLPAVLKTDGTSGGVGVRIVATLEEAERAFAALHTPPRTARMVKRALFDRDVTLALPWLYRGRPRVSIQNVVRGFDATSAAACWQGKVLAILHFEVLHTWEPKGPASVVRITENAEMLATVAKIVDKLSLSGLYGFDFMIEDHTGGANLIEMNPRSTQTCHLALGPGRDLPAALFSAVTGEPVRVTESVTEKREIALFPQEWQRNPASPYLRNAYHDVPWNEPELVRACIESRSPRRIHQMLAARLFSRSPKQSLSHRPL
jgi:formate-dependent phosphoribosylglycinamide formyltransferase (GAR transformylase)